MYAEHLLNQSGLIDNPYHAISIIAKYYYHCFGYRKKKIAKLLTTYLEKNYPRYKPQKQSWITTIEKVSGKAGKYPLYEVDEIEITDSELSVIDDIEHNDAIAGLDISDIKNIKRLSFTMLCLAKLGTAKNEKSNGWVNTQIKDLIKYSRINCSQKKTLFLISHMNAAGLLEFAKKNTNLSNRVTFINNDGNVVLHISDFRELGYTYLKYCGENMVECSQCGILIRGNANHTRRYCSDCDGSTPMVTKRISCIDCGTVFAVSAKNNKTCRCNECQRIVDIERKKERNKRYYEKNKTATNPD